MVGVCPKCKKDRHLTRHHVKPKRYFKRSGTIKICRRCHDELESLIPYERKPIKFYYRIIRIFMEGGHCGNYNH